MYFTFFSTAAIQNREIKTHLSNAEKYLDELDYEKAIAEYEEALKLKNDTEELIDEYINIVCEYAEKVADEDVEEASDILYSAIKFLNKISGENDYIKNFFHTIHDFPLLMIFLFHLIFYLVLQA